jgi:hypothetical protein
VSWPSWDRCDATPPGPQRDHRSGNEIPGQFRYNGAGYRPGISIGRLRKFRYNAARISPGCTSFPYSPGEQRS